MINGGFPRPELLQSETPEATKGEAGGSWQKPGMQCGVAVGEAFLVVETSCETMERQTRTKASQTPKPLKQALTPEARKTPNL